MSAVSQRLIHLPHSLTFDVRAELKWRRMKSARSFTIFCLSLPTQIKWAPEVDCLGSQFQWNRRG